MGHVRVASVLPALRHHFSVLDYHQAVDVLAGFLRGVEISVHRFAEFLGSGSARQALGEPVDVDQAYSALLDDLFHAGAGQQVGDSLAVGGHVFIADMEDGLHLVVIVGGVIQEEVAEKLHMSRSTVSRLETGVTPPVEETIAAFAALYEIPANELTDVQIPPGEEDERAFAIFGLLLSFGYWLLGYGTPLVFAAVIYSAYRRFSRSLIVFGVIILLFSLLLFRMYLPAVIRLFGG